MAEISLKIKSDFDKAAADFKKIDMSSESFQKSLAKLQTQMANGSIDKFMQKNQLSAAAMTAAKGASAGLQKELSGLQSEIQRLIKAGLDPMNPALDKMKIRMTEIQKQLPNTNSMFGGMGNAVAIAATAIASSKIVGQLIDINKAALSAASGMEQNRVALTTMLGGAEKAKTLLTQIQDFAAATPFQFNELVDASKRMIAFGFSSEEVVQKLGMVGNVAAGLGQPIGDMIYLFGQIKTQGKAMTQDLNQFANRGVPIFEEVAKAMGVPTKQVRKLAEEGKITYDVINKAFENMTNSGGKFAGLMEAQSKTLGGQWSNFNDQLDKTKVIMGEGLMAGAKKDLSVASALLQTYTEIAKRNQERAASEAQYITLQGKTAEAIIGTKEKLEMIAELDRDKRGAALVYQGYLRGDIALNQQQIAQLEQRLGLQRSLGDIAAQANKNELESWKQRGLIVGEVQKKVEGGSKGGGGGKGAAKTEAQIFQDNLNAMKLSQEAFEQEKLNTMQSFYDQRVALQGVMNDEELAAYMAQESKKIETSKLTDIQKLEAMNALDKAVQKSSQNQLKTQLQFGAQIASYGEQMFSDLATTMQNAGKESKAFAIGMKAMSMAQAGINSFLAFTSVLKDETIWPSWLRLPLAGTILAAGLAKQAAIASTPISAETGLTNYTVPDIRSNRNDGAAVMAQGGEEVSITPRGESSSNLTNIDISISEQAIFNIVARGIKTGQINLNNKNVGRGVFAN